MAFNNVPVNGWPQIKGIEEVKNIPGMASDINTLKTTVGDSSSGLIKSFNDFKALFDITTLSHSFEYTNCTYVAGGIARIGNIVFVNLRIGVTETGAVNISGFPGYATLMGGATGVILACTNINDQVVAGCAINGNGILSTGTLTGGKAYAFNGVYVADSPATRDGDAEELVKETETTKRSTKKNNGGK